MEYIYPTVLVERSFREEYSARPFRKEDGGSSVLSQCNVGCFYGLSVLLFTMENIYPSISIGTCQENALGTRGGG